VERNGGAPGAAERRPGDRFERVREVLAELDGRPTPARELARRSGVAAASVHDVLRKLEAAGELRTERILRPDGRYAAAIRRLVKPAVKVMAEEEAKREARALPRAVSSTRSAVREPRKSSSDGDIARDGPS
jgi:DNA-binding Lrp family transcriptional regulator